MTSLKKIVIVGGGAGGLELATRLGHKLGRLNKAEIILVDCYHSHLWKPLLHEVATGSLDEGVNAISYRAHARNHAFKFQFGSMIDIDREHKLIVLDEIRDSKDKLLVSKRKLYYDILVVAIGSISNDFGTAGIREHCMFLDKPSQAQYFHQEMLNKFLALSANRHLDCQVKVAIVGGGATGVELSAELYNAVQQLHSYGFQGLNNKALNVTLIEASERILPALSQRISTVVDKELTKLGVRVLTNSIVTSAESGGLHTKHSEYIASDLMVWAAGIKAPDFMNNIAGLETNNINQLVVKATLQTTNDDNIFAIGDCASCYLPSGGVVPPRAQAAHQMALCVAKNILALLRGDSLKLYHYTDYGSLVSLSKFSTIGSLMGNWMRGSMMIEGRIARFLYLAIYRKHQIALHGYVKTLLIMLVERIHRVIRPHMKLH